MTVNLIHEAEEKISPENFEEISQNFISIVKLIQRMCILLQRNPYHCTYYTKNILNCLVFLGFSALEADTI